LGLLLMLVAPAKAQQFVWVTNNGTIAISGYSGPGVDVIIPATITGLPVTRIGGGAFARTRITGVTIPYGVISVDVQAFDSCGELVTATVPDSVVSLGVHAFYYCTSLQSLTLGTNLSSIGHYAFLNCTSLTNLTLPGSVTNMGVWVFGDCFSLGNITLGNGLTTIGGTAFSGCLGLTNVTIPDTVTTIGGAAFEGCTNLPAVTIPNSVTSIGDRAFHFCNRLADVVIPESVTNLGLSAFGSCASLEGITVDALNPAYTSVDGVVFDKSQGMLIQYPGGKAGNYTIPSSVTNIKQSAFDACNQLSGVTIPSSVVSIGANAFLSCNSLRGVTIPNSVKNVGGGAFAGCAALSDVTISTNLPEIASGMFSSCTSLQSATIPDSVTNIEDQAFESCTSLRNISVPDSVESIGQSAFWGCTGLTNATLGSGVTSIGQWAFTGTSLASVNIPAKVTSSDLAFTGCSALADLTLTDGLSSIGFEMFSGCSSLTNVSIPASVTNIGSEAFADCGGVTAFRVDPLNPAYRSVDGVLFDKSETTLIQFPAGKAGSYTIPNGVTTIGGVAFAGNPGLTNVRVPTSLTGFFSGAFAGCTAMTGLYFEGNAPSVLGYDTNAVFGVVYYLPGTTGWGAFFAGYPTSIWQLANPVILTVDSHFGLRSNQFGFTVSWATNTAVVIEAATNLVSPSWLPVSTNALTGGTTYFSDSQWRNYPTRFYRVRSWQ
jgi:hypothetical protein